MLPVSRAIWGEISETLVQICGDKSKKNLKELIAKERIIEIKDFVI